MLDAETIDAIAAAVAERLNDPPQFVGVTELARMFGVSTDVVYRRADELGAVRIGARMVFDPHDVANRMRKRPAQDVITASTVPTRRRRSPSSAVELLPIRISQPTVSNDLKQSSGQSISADELARGDR